MDVCCSLGDSLSLTLRRPGGVFHQGVCPTLTEGGQVARGGQSPLTPVTGQRRANARAWPSSFHTTGLCASSRGCEHQAQELEAGMEREHAGSVFARSHEAGVVMQIPLVYKRTVESKSCFWKLESIKVACSAVEKTLKVFHSPELQRALLFFFPSGKHYLPEVCVSKSWPR